MCRNNRIHNSIKGFSILLIALTMNFISGSAWAQCTDSGPAPNEQIWVPNAQPGSGQVIRVDYQKRTSLPIRLRIYRQPDENSGFLSCLTISPTGEPHYFKWPGGYFSYNFEVNSNGSWVYENAYEIGTNPIPGGFSLTLRPTDNSNPSSSSFVTVAWGTNISMPPPVQPPAQPQPPAHPTPPRAQNCMTNAYHSVPGGGVQPIFCSGQGPRGTPCSCFGIPGTNR